MTALTSKGAEFTAERLTALTAAGLLSEANVKQHDANVEILRMAAVVAAGEGRRSTSMHTTLVKAMNRGTYNLLVHTLNKKGFKVSGMYHLHHLTIRWGTV